MSLRRTASLALAIASLLGSSTSAAAATAKGTDPSTSTGGTATGGGGGTATGGGGGGGGSTQLPAPTISTSANLSKPIAIGSGRTLPSFTVSAQSPTSAIPTVTLTSGPTGLNVLYSTSSPGARGAKPTATLSLGGWAPSRDQIGPRRAVFSATLGGAVATLSVDFDIRDAPEAPVSLSASRSADSISANWNAGIGGVGAPSFVVEACYYYYNAAFRTICDIIERTSATSSSFAGSKPAPIAGFPTQTYYEVHVTAYGADGEQGGTSILAVAP